MPMKGMEVLKDSCILRKQRAEDRDMSQDNI